MLTNRLMKTMRRGLCPLLIFFLLLGSFPVRANAMMTTTEEKELGKTVLREIEKEADFVRDLDVQMFVEKVGYSIVRQVGYTPYEFKFYVIKSVDPNAFAVPGGYVFVTSGLLVSAESEQEVAGVISHEIAHVAQRHIAQLIDKSKGINIASMIAVMAAMLVGRGGQGAQAGAAMAMATAEAMALKYTREMETDADQNSLPFMIKAGYDPHGIIVFLNRIQRISLAMAPNVPPYLMTHPVTENRISLIENLLRMQSKVKGPFKTFGNYKKIQAKALAEERDPQASVSYFKSLIDANPNTWEGYYGMGLAYQKMGRFDKSIEVLQKAHSLVPDDTDISKEIGIDYFLSGKIDSAIDQLETLLASPGGGKNDLSIYYYLGRGYQEKGDFNKALPLLLKVRKTEPDFTEVYLPLGSLYGRTAQKGLSHFYFGKHFKSRHEMKTALLHFKTAMELLEKGSSERDEAQKEIKELSPPSSKKI